jgi:uncharacterized protein with GYD domain
MGKYLISGTYEPDGMKGVMEKGGTARVEAIKKMTDGMGGSVESFYFGFGADDVYVIVDAPDHESMIATAGAVKSSGLFRDYKTTVLLTPEQVDAAAGLNVDYTPPGG